MQNSQSVVKHFYDAFSRKLIVDYVNGNPRIEAAIKHALRWIPPNAEHVLDIGCGIGWSTWEIKRHYPQAHVFGIDLSQRMIETAKSLFGESELVFAVKNILENEQDSHSPFDAIIMLDVYEHIPKKERRTLHQTLYHLLSPTGVIILTCPSVSHQNYLRAYNPGGLQPVDEDVTQEDIEILAQDVQGEVRLFKYVSIWNNNDYFHAVIQRNSNMAQRHAPANKPVSLEERKVREQRVASRLGIRVMHDGTVLANRSGPTVCVISPGKGAYSETFIQAHIEHLPAKVELLYDWPPVHDGRSIITQFPTLREHTKRAILRRVSHWTFESAIDQALVRFFKQQGIQAVLAEYGPTGVRVMNACQQANIPLIVHFHGYDAYRRDILEAEGQHYPELFEKAAAVIAVSKDMMQQLRNLGAPEEKLYYNSCGVDTSLFQKADPSKAPPVFVAVGRFVDKKAPHLTLLAFKKVLESRSDARLVMIGDGPLWEACKQLAKVWKIESAVDFRGVRSHAEVAATMQGARAFVQHSIRPTHGDSEGTPVAVLEAGASGLSVVATRHAGIKDVVIEGKTGFLVDEGDMEGMAEYMIRLANDPELAARLGRAARERIEAEFSMEKSIAGLWEIIKGAIRDAA